MKLNIAICDDNETELNELFKLIFDYEQASPHNLHIDSFTDAGEFLNSYSGRRYDLVFLDIELKKDDGIHVARSIRRIPDYDVKIVFTTSYPQYMIQSFGVQPFQYLLKPVSAEKIKTVLEDAVGQIKNASRTLKFLETHSSHTIISCDHISYISTDRDNFNHIIFHIDGQPLSERGTIKEYYEILKVRDFFIPVRGFLVNPRHIVAIDKSGILLDDNAVVPVSRSSQADVRRIFSKYLVDKLNQHTN